uniref:RNA helicase n=1 Tax=Neospora caninum (strain Liverpool) TaxID=572307 RepID=A0A0F7U8G4_NEOCL|nr:TPA: chloroplastic DEAD-box ATP-dependent RNA helicase 3, related [Neospora caninum Liverpool]
MEAPSASSLSPCPFSLPSAGSSPDTHLAPGRCLSALPFPARPLTPLAPGDPPGSVSRASRSSPALRVSCSVLDSPHLLTSRDSKMDQNRLLRSLALYLRLALLALAFSLLGASARTAFPDSRARPPRQSPAPWSSLLRPILPLSPPSVSPFSRPSRCSSGPICAESPARISAAASRTEPGGCLPSRTNRSSTFFRSVVGAPSPVCASSCAFVSPLFASSFSPPRAWPLFAPFLASCNQPTSAQSLCPASALRRPSPAIESLSFFAPQRSTCEDSGAAHASRHLRSAELSVSSPTRLFAEKGEDPQRDLHVENDSEGAFGEEARPEAERSLDASVSAADNAERRSGACDGLDSRRSAAKDGESSAVSFGDAPFSASTEEEEGDYWSDASLVSLQEEPRSTEEGERDIADAKSAASAAGRDKSAAKPSEAKSAGKRGPGLRDGDSADGPDAPRRKKPKEQGTDEARQGEIPEEDATLTFLFPEEEEARQKNAAAAAVARSLASTTSKLFASLHPKISSATVEALQARGITAMTPIQSESYDVLFDGRDVVARSETGSGKTIGFALPLMERERRDMERDFAGDLPGEDAAEKELRRRDSDFYEQPRVLVLEPTRELARQVAQEVERLGDALDLSSFCVYGGVPVESQLRHLRREKQRRSRPGASPGFAGDVSPLGRRRQRDDQRDSGRLDVLIATPGRLLDLMGLNEGRETPQQDVDLSSVRHVVLDEADEMLKLGFAADVEKILQKVKENPFNVQVILFSATTPDWVKDVAGAYLRNPKHIDILAERKLRTSTTVSHLAVRLPALAASSHGRVAPWSGRGSSPTAAAAPLLQDLILAESASGKQAIIFVPTKADADALANAADFEKIGASVLHGDIGQETRQAVMEGFRRGRYKVLIATDVAARGIDVDSVDLVIHCGVPTDADTYIHRSGRTGRAGRAGKSLVLVSPQEVADLERLERACGFKFSFIHLPSPNAVLKSGANTASRLLDSISPSVLPFFRPAAEDLLRRGDLYGVSAVEIVARALAAAANMKTLPQRSLLTGMAAQLTVLFTNRQRDWKSPNDIYYWIRAVAEDLGVELPPTLGEIRQSAADRRVAYFDLPVEIGAGFLKAFKTRARAEHVRVVAMSRAEHLLTPLVNENAGERNLPHFFGRGGSSTSRYRRSGSDFDGSRKGPWTSKDRRSSLWKGRNAGSFGSDSHRGYSHGQRKRPSGREPNENIWGSSSRRSREGRNDDAHFWDV